MDVVAKKVRKAVKKAAHKIATKRTATIGGVTSHVVRTKPKTAKARKIRQAVLTYYG